MFDKKFYDDKSFKLISDIKRFNLNQNFILSGANLAFLGYFANNELILHKNLFHWPDGLWIKKHIDIKKTPGKELLENLKLNNSIRCINVIGNLSENSKKYLEKKFKLKIINFKLPYGNFETLKKNNLKLKKNTLTFITLPTPKQEKFAFHLIKKNKNFKIICIGASIAIASGDEKPVPYFLRNVEFLWRLRSDFYRRIIRLFETLVYYLKGKFLGNFKNMRFF